MLQLTAPADIQLESSQICFQIVQEFSLELYDNYAKTVPTEMSIFIRDEQVLPFFRYE
jgi:hypothetical protein